MLFSMEKLDGFVIAAEDGEIGKVKHAYFDDERWTIRHLVVSTGSWLAGRDVLISPHAVKSVDTGAGRLVVSLTRSQVERAPDIDTDKPVSRQQEASYYEYYGYPYYWGGPGLWGPVAIPIGFASMAGAGVAAAARPGPPGAEQRRGETQEPAGDPHLRSTAEVTGYDVEASDGTIGHIDDFLFDTTSWAILHLVVDTRNWLPGRKVLVDPAEVESVMWDRGHVRVRLSRDGVKASDEYRPGAAHASE